MARYRLTLDLDGVPAAFALMIESRIGQLDPSASHGLRVARLPVNADDYPALASLAITGKLRWWPKLTERYRQTVDEPSRDLDVASLLSATPFARTRQWTAEVRDFETAPMIIVAGDQPSDHALALLCDRTFDNACWLPIETLRGTDEAAAAVRATMHTLWNDWPMQYRRGDSPICLTSTSGVKRHQPRHIPERRILFTFKGDYRAHWTPCLSRLLRRRRQREAYLGH